MDAEAATDGGFALLTNLDASVTAAEVLLRYKGQEAVGRRYGNLKGPAGGRPDVPAQQPADRRADHRDQPRPAGLLPDRKTGSPPTSRRRPNPADCTPGSPPALPAGSS